MMISAIFIILPALKFGDILCARNYSVIGISKTNFDSLDFFCIRDIITSKVALVRSDESRQGLHIHEKIRECFENIDKKAVCTAVQFGGFAKPPHNTLYKSVMPLLLRYNN